MHGKGVHARGGLREQRQAPPRSRLGSRRCTGGPTCRPLAAWYASLAAVLLAKNASSSTGVPSASLAEGGGSTAVKI